VSSFKTHLCTNYLEVTWHNGNAFHSINEVAVHWAGLVLRWVTACRQVNHLGM